MNEKGTLKKEQNTLQNEQDTLQNKIFDGEQARVLNSEQAHLTMTHGKLCAMEAALEEKIEAINEKAAKEKQDIRSNLSLNFDSDTDSMETYIEFEAMSHSIDQYNIEQDAAQEKLGRVKRLRKAPYFARVKLQFDPEEAPEDYYIGSAGIAENAYEHLVIDWRSPIAETYYNQQNGKTFYMVNGNRVDVDLQLRRQYNLEEDRLFSFFDTQVAIEDPMLLQSLASRRTDKMKAITATIQKEQNAVIRSEDVPVLLVNGIAGSGKTSVLLQRIAYLFYRQRENLRPEQVYLLTISVNQAAVGVTTQITGRGRICVRSRFTCSPSTRCSASTSIRCCRTWARRIPGRSRGGTSCTSRTHRTRGRANLPKKRTSARWSAR